MTAFPGLLLKLNAAVNDSGCKKQVLSFINDYPVVNTGNSKNSYIFGLYVTIRIHTGGHFP